MTKPLPLENHSSMYTHEYMVMKSCRHGTLLFNQQDTFVGRSLDLYGEWCEAEIDLLAQVLKPGDVVLDVGANIGCHTVPFAKLVGDSGRVVAFEPQRLVFQNLCANLALNALRNVVTYDAIMPNHWHFVVRPETSDQVSEFFRRLTVMYTMRWHAHYKTGRTGHLYQGRFKSFPIQPDGHIDSAALRGAESHACRFR